jgi:hypothetical protein
MEVLGQILKIMRPSDDNLPIGEVIVASLERLRIARRWVWATTCTKIGNIAGAIHRASHYDKDSRDTALNDDPAIRDYSAKAKAMKLATAWTAETRDAKRDEVFAIVRGSQSDEATALLLLWITIQRISSVAALRTEDVHLATDGVLTLLVRVAKTVRYTGPYEVSTVVPVEFVERVQELLRRRRQQKEHFLFVDADHLTLGEHQSKRLSRHSIRKITSRLRHRTGMGSMLTRRGALRHLDDQGVDDSVLISFSKHTKPKSLQHYLRPRGDREAEEKAMIAASRLLGAGPPSDLPFQRFAPLLSLAELHEVFGARATERNGKALPLHLKQVGEIDLNKVEDMAQQLGDEALLQKLKAARRPLYDPEYYAGYEEQKPPHLKFSFSEADLSAYVAAGHAELLDDPADAKGWVRILTRTEEAKHRRRCLGHTITANRIPRLVSCELPTAPEVQRAIWGCPDQMGFTVDFAQWFSQFPIEACVRDYFCFVFGGRTYRLTKMSMGAAQSCDLAQVVAEVIAK